MEMVVDYVYKSNDVKELIFLNNRFERNFVFVARLLSVDLGGREKGTTPMTMMMFGITLVRSNLFSWILRMSSY